MSPSVDALSPTLYWRGRSRAVDCCVCEAGTFLGFHEVNPCLPLSFFCPSLAPPPELLAYWQRGGTHEGVKRLRSSISRHRYPASREVSVAVRIVGGAAERKNKTLKRCTTSFRTFLGTLTLVLPPFLARRCRRRGSSTSAGLCFRLHMHNAE